MRLCSIPLVGVFYSIPQDCKLLYEREKLVDRFLVITCLAGKILGGIYLASKTYHYTVRFFFEDLGRLAIISLRINHLVELIILHDAIVTFDNMIDITINNNKDKNSDENTIIRLLKNIFLR